MCLIRDVTMSQILFIWWLVPAGVVHWTLSPHPSPVQTSALFGQSARQTKTKRDTLQKQWMRILTRYQVCSRITMFSNCIPLICHKYGQHSTNNHSIDLMKIMFFVFLCCFGIGKIPCYIYQLEIELKLQNVICNKI